MHLFLSVQLQKQGFLSTVVLAGATPPTKLLPPTGIELPLQFQSRVRHDNPSTTSSLSQSTPQTSQTSRLVENNEDVDKQALLEGDADDGFPIDELFPASDLTSESEQLLKDEALHNSTEDVTQTNRASRRLWLGLKYWDGEPVLRKMRMISRPRQRLWLTHSDLSRIVRGKRSNYVDPLTRVGECLFVSTDKGVMEARECVERQIGGLALCRAWG